VSLAVNKTNNQTYLEATSLWLPGKW